MLKGQIKVKCDHDKWTVTESDNTIILKPGMLHILAIGTVAAAAAAAATVEIILHAFS